MEDDNEMKSERKRVTVSIPEYLLDEVDARVEAGAAESRSDFVADALGLYIEVQNTVDALRDVTEVDDAEA